MMYADVCYVPSCMTGMTSSAYLYLFETLIMSDCCIGSVQTFAPAKKASRSMPTITCTVYIALVLSIRAAWSTIFFGVVYYYRSDLHHPMYFLLTFLQVYSAIFTSPSSVENVNDENEPPVAKKRKSQKDTKAPVAKLMNMEGKVTGRSIAYAAVTVSFFSYIFTSN